MNARHRIEKRHNGCTMLLVFLSPVEHVSHESERPIKMVWHLRHPIPLEMFEESEKGLV